MTAATLGSPWCWSCAYALQHTHPDDGRENARHYREVHPTKSADLVDAQDAVTAALEARLARPQDSTTYTEDAAERAHNDTPKASTP